MALQKLILTPGVTTEASQTLANGTWSETNLIRWRDGFLEKMFGWTPLCLTAVSGVARSLHSWVDTESNQYLAVGTNSRLQVINTGTLYDITPLLSTDNVAVAFTTTDTSTTVTITDVGSDAAAGSEVYIPVPVAVGGIILQGYYTIDSIVDPDNFTITAADAATASVVAGGAVPLFNTTNTSAIITVTLVNHGYSIGDTFTVQVSTTVATVVIFGDYQVATVPTADTFTIIALTNANATTSGSENGGNVRLEFLIAPGPVSTMALAGYGAGPYGAGTWGIGTGSSQFLEFLRYWFLDNFGVTLLAAVSQGPMYEWNDDLTARAMLISGPPTINAGMFVSMPQEIVVSLGAEVLGVQDPLLVRWSDAGDYTEWTASSTNQAGSYRLPNGARIVGGIQGPLAGLIWTDSALWQMQYVQPPFIFTFTVIAYGTGLIAPLGMGILTRDVYWISQLGFYRYGSGAPEQLPCPVWDTIFQDLDMDNADKIICAVTSHTNEVAWFYPSLSGGTGEIDAYVKVCVSGGTFNWDYGPVDTLMTRTAWLDNNVGTATTIGVGLDNIVYNHESGYNNGTSAAMTGVRAMSGFIDISEGQEMMRIDQIIPDFIFRGTDPTVNIYLHVLDQPNSTPVVHGPFEVTEDTTLISLLPAARGRQIAFEVTSDAADMWWRLGAVRLRTAVDGRRPATL